MKAHMQNALRAFTLTLRDRLHPSPWLRRRIRPITVIIVIVVLATVAPTQVAAAAGATALWLQLRRRESREA